MLSFIRFLSIFYFVLPFFAHALRLFFNQFPLLINFYFLYTGSQEFPQNVTCIDFLPFLSLFLHIWRRKHIKARVHRNQRINFGSISRAGNFKNDIDCWFIFYSLSYKGEHLSQLSYSPYIIHHIHRSAFIQTQNIVMLNHYLIS